MLHHDWFSKRWGTSNRTLQNQTACIEVEQSVQYKFCKKRENVAGFPCIVLLDLNFDE